MKKIKRFFQILLMLILIMIIFRYYFTSTVNAKYGGKSSLKDFTELSWDGVKNLSFQSDVSLDATHNGDTTNYSGLANSMCFHASSVTDGGNMVKLKALIEIDEDGKVTITTASGSKTSDDEVSGAKLMAAYAAQVTGKGVVGDRKSSIWDTYRADFWRIMEKYGFMSYLTSNGVPSFGAAHTLSKNFVTSEGQYAQTYENETNTDGKTYKARIFIFFSVNGKGGVQDRALLFGTEAETPKLSIDKYITKVNGSDVSGGSRAGKSNSKKKSSAPTVELGDKITYEIKIKNESSVKAKNVSFEDDFNTTCFNPTTASCTISDGSFKTRPSVNASGKITGKIKQIKGGHTVTITVQLTVNESNSINESTKYKNQAKCDGCDWSKDYVKVYIPKPMIDKYITKIETIGGDDTVSSEEATNLNFGTTRAATADSDWNGGNDSSKRNSPAKVAYGGVKVYYTIAVKNNGTRKLKGTLTDEYASFFTNLQGSVNNVTVELDAGETKTFNFTLDGTAGAADGKYENKATFTPTKGKVVSSSDWVQLGEIKPPKINKYITSITNGNHSGDRSELSEVAKANSPANAGINGSEKTISYTIEITNPNTFEIEGTFTDEIDDGVTIDSIKIGSDSISSGDDIDIAANSTVTINITATFPEGGDSGIYANTATFEYDTMSIESRDYFEVDEEMTADVELHKYISSVTSSGNLIGIDRSSWSIDDKNDSPVEVVKGTEVTYKITLENNVHYQNVSGSVHGDRCDGTNTPGSPDHLDKHDLSYLKCEDIWDSGLEYKSITGTNSVSYDSSSHQIVWKNVDEGATAEAYLTLTVTASDMTLKNLVNTAGGSNKIYYEYEWYQCTPYHTVYYTVPCAVHGSHTRCTHESCGLNHNHTTKSGTLTAEDKDYVRLLDPYIEGDVWDESVAIDGLRKDGESIATIIREDYKNIIVKLWKTDGTLVATKTIDANGHYTFGRVRKGTIKTGGSDRNTDTWYEVSENQKFNYNSAVLQTYYITFEYNGERYQATTPSGADNLREENANYRIDSNAEEQERQKFNDSLETISYNRAFGNKTGSGDGKPLAYEISGGGETGLQVSTITWDGNSLEGTTSTDWASNYSSADGSNRSATIIAKSYDLFFENGEIDYLKHIDLGLYQKEQADLSLTKDVIKAEVTVNGHPTTYDYAGYGTDPYVANSNNVLNEPYLLSIYREDYEYRTSNYDATIQSILNENNPYTNFGRDNDLQVLLTYKITVTNNSDSASAVIREIVDYSSKEMVLLDGTTQIAKTNEEGEVELKDLTSSDASSFKNVTHADIEYNQNFIRGDELTNVTLGKDESLEIYAMYRVLKTADGYLMIDGADDGTDDCKMNIAEIGAYSIYKDDKPAGLIDKNSNPGNVEFDDGKVVPDKFEDDTFETGIVVTLKDIPPPSPGPKREKYYYRNITGIVFEEVNPTVTATSDGQLVGDGIKNGSDIPAKNVLVKLYEVVQKKDAEGNVVEDYYVDTGLWYRTGEDGRYYFGDMSETFNESKQPVNTESTTESKDDCYKLHAGLYVVRFIYGDEADYLVTDDGNTIKYSGQDYQSAKYTDVGDSTKEDEIVKATAFAEKSSNENPFNSSSEPTLGTTIYSVAKDNEVRRLEVNEYSTTTTYPMDTILKANQGSEEAKILAAHSGMFADTKVFDMDIEYYDNYTVKTERSINGRVKTIASFYYSVRDINFGLIERPKTKLELMNDITEVRAITSDGDTLLDIFFDVNYEKEVDADGKISIKHTTTLNQDKSIGYDQVQVLNRNGSNQGFRYANIDSELLQGMTITIKFKVAVANISDVDHIASWLEEKMRSGADVDLDVKTYNSTTTDTKVSYSSNDSIVKDYINGQEREYSYTNSYLYNLLYNGDSSKGITALRNAGNGFPVYGTADIKGSESVRKAYSYTNIKNKAQSDYKTGYYLGDIYYTNTASGNEARVETRVDQYIDYVDNDLIFKPEENINSNEQITYLTYTTAEIAQKGLLKDITDTVKVISDGEKDYYNADVPNTNNNLAFNIEDANVNSNFYKFLTPITSSSEINLYEIDLQASRTLTSEMDLEGIVIDNIAEIIKSTNTAGRKVYVKAEGANTGYLGNTTKDPIESINKPGSTTTLVDIAKLEIDTDYTEYVTFSPPTGLTGEQAIAKTVAEKTGDVLLILIPVIIIIAGMSYVTVQVIRRKKFYK